MSVIVPTHDRPASLVRLLEALAVPGRTPPHEVIVVADGRSPATFSAVADIRTPFPVRVMELEPSRGPGIARNTGAEAATGDLLLFIDDDIEPFGDVVREHARLHDGGRSVVIGAPRAVTRREPSFRELAGWAWWEQQFERMRRPAHRFGYEDVFTGLLSVPRAFWRELGGFDATLRCREDFELGLRLVRSRCAFAFTEAGGGWHHENRSGARLVKRKQDEGRADVAIARLHPWAFRALPLSRGAPDPRAGIVRRAAFAWPVVGDVAASVTDRLLNLLEFLRMRGTWRRVQGGIMYYAYWRGAARALGHPDALQAIREAAQATEPPEWRELEVDLACDLERLAEQLDAVRPDALRVRLDDVPLGSVLHSTGSEPLRGRHLLAPPDDLTAVLMTAVAITRLRSGEPTEPPAHA